MPFDLASFRNAIERLDEALAMAAADPSNEVVRDGVIQRFEYTCELSHKTLRRFLRVTEPSPEIVSDMSFPNLIRLASQRHLLIGDWETWNHYREVRGTISHAYDGAKAAAVFSRIPAFLAEAKICLPPWLGCCRHDRPLRPSAGSPYNR